MWAVSLTPVGPYFPAPSSTPTPTPKPTKNQPLNHFPTDVAVKPRLSVKAAAARNESNDAEQDEGKQISGSDVLWALQRAAAKKSKSKRKKKGLASSQGSQREKDGIDYGKVRPLEIKSEWNRKLDELEKRLQELEEHTT